VLLTDASYKHTWALAKQFHDLGYEVEVLGSTLHPLRFSKYFTIIKFNFHSSASWIINLRNILKNGDYDLFVPIGANSVQLAAEFKNEISEYTRVPITDQSKINFAFNKRNVSSLANKIGIRAPKEYSVKEINEKKDEIFPLFVKYVFENKRKFEPLLLKSHQHFVNFIQKYSNIPENEMLFQERIQGQGQAFFAFYCSGKLHEYYMHKRIREISKQGGASTCAETIFEEDLLIHGRKILDVLKWHGPAMVEFKREVKSNELFIMEINPKFWGSLALGIQSGVNVAEIIIKIAENLPYIPTPNSELKKIRLSWPLNGDLKNILKLNDSLGVLKDLFNPKVKKEFYVSDLKPLLLKFPYSILKSLLNLRALYLLKTFITRINTIGFRFAFHRLVEEYFGLPNLKYGKMDRKLYFGGQFSKLGLLKLKFYGIKSVLSLRNDFSDPKISFIKMEYFKIDIPEYEEITIENFTTSIDCINRQIELGRPIFVHCREGVGRAPSVVVGFLLSKGVNLKEALETVYASRPFSNILEEQLASLRRYEEELST
jgi:predicted ATP-grasp superfamily ATP-dependent carboligase/protein tyrosine phosphatase (PTP) superfamily phosphohydrolase (DUF442 family)